jgi:hypothetical protein
LRDCCGVGGRRAFTTEGTENIEKDKEEKGENIGQHSSAFCSSPLVKGSVASVLSVVENRPGFGLHPSIAQLVAKVRFVKYNVSGSV